MKTNKFYSIFGFLFFVLSCLYLLVILFNSISLNFSLGPFDDSLRVLESFYFSVGLKPYNDFSFVYPPGQIFLSLISPGNIETIIRIPLYISGILSLILIIFSYLKTKSFIISGTVALIIGISFYPTFPLAETIWIGILLIIFINQIKKIKYYEFTLYSLSTILLLLKWDRIVFLIATYVLFFIILKIWRKKISKINIKLIEKDIKILSLSVLTSFIIISIYLLISQIDIKNAFYFIFIVPFKIAPFRDLPLISKDLINNGKIIYLFFAFTLILFIYLFRKFRKNEFNNLDFIFTVTTLSLLPYAMGRTDVPHVIPLITCITLIFAFLSIQKGKFFKFLFTISIIYIFYSLIFYNLPKINTHTLFDQIYGCKKAVKNINFESVFVGKNDYSHFLINYASLYLVAPSKAPATKYISDEPGLQNNCYDSSIIVTELNKSKKPMLTFIETSPQNSEPNKSSYMKSCGKIENFLNSKKYTILGSCKVNNANFQIRLYK